MTEKRSLKAISALILWIILVTLGSLLPSEGIGVEDFINADKIVHVCFYMVMTYLLLRVLRSHSIGIYIASVTLCSAYGALMEYLQGASDFGRYFDYYDIIANISGSLIGALFYRLTNK